MAEEFVSRREFDQLARVVDRIDMHGSRGIGALQQQVGDVVRDVAELKVETTRALAAHRDQHDEEIRERTSGRRWLVGIAVACLTAVGGLYPAIIYAVHH